MYFDLKGEVIIEEIASYYRVATYDTSSGEILGAFKDYSILNDSLIASGEMVIQNQDTTINNFNGDTSLLPIVKKMGKLKAVYVRKDDYPELRKCIEPHKTNEERIDMGEFKVVSAQPEFPGGQQALYWFIRQFIEYPEEAREKGISGVVRVRFTVGTDGSMNNIKVAHGIGHGCDKEALRIMNLLPDWLPALQDGKPKPVTLSIPISFQMK